MTKTIWDAIVVGAGSAGAAAAVRLAEQGRRVLLLEAGRDDRSADVPEAWRSPNPVVALTDPVAVEGMVWPGLNAARTQSQPMAPYWRGRGMGGSSAINGQIAIRPPMQDFADWARQGCLGWGPEDVLPHFAGLEDDEEFGDEPHHGRGGPTPIHRNPRDQWGAVDAALADSALAGGADWTADVNAPEGTGVSPYPINSRDGRRVSTNDAYLEGARNLPNLTIRGETLVDRVLFEGDRAVGVTCRVDGRDVVEHADTVILSAGVTHSPAILMRSGIGPQQHLRSLGIDVRADLPVGRGLQDHPMAVLSLPLAQHAATQTPHDRHTNVCVRWTSGPSAPVNDLMVVSMNQSVLAMASADTGSRLGAYGIWLNRNDSRGELTLRSTDPADQPVLNLRMLSDPGDRARMRHGVRRLVELAARDETTSVLDGSLEEENRALFAVLDDDAALDEHLLNTVGDAQHGTSSCRMGAADQTDSVVDPMCRVLGVDGLHVVDASVLPSVPRANTNLTAIMIGELMADRLA